MTTTTTKRTPRQRIASLLVDRRPHAEAMAKRMQALGHDLDAQRWADLAATLS